MTIWPFKLELFTTSIQIQRINKTVKSKIINSGLVLVFRKLLFFLVINLSFNVACNMAQVVDILENSNKYQTVSTTKRKIMPIRIERKKSTP